MAIYLADFIEHSNNTLYAVDSNFVRGGIRSSHATWTSLLDTIDGTQAGTAGNIIGQLKPLSTMVWIGTAATGGFYVLTDIAGADIAGTESNSGWKALSSLLGVTSSVAVLDAADATSSHYVVLSGTASGTTSLKTDAGIQYTPSTNILDVTATSAQKWSTARTVNFNGSGSDVTGSFSIDGSANVSDVVLTIAADSVALGTNTTGDYVSTLTAGTGVTLTNAAGGTEGAQYTVALDYAGPDSFIHVANTVDQAVVVEDYILIADVSNDNNVKKAQLSALPFTNYTAPTLTAGNGLESTGSLASGGTYTLNLDFSELADLTTDISGATEFILLNSGTESRKAANEIKLSNFVNDVGWTSNLGSVTSVTLTAGTGITITDSGTAITTSGTRTISLTTNSLIIGSTSIALGGTSTSLAGLTGLDFVANQNAAIASSIGTGILTIGGSTSAVSVPGALTVGGNLIVNGSTTSVNSTQTNFKDDFIYLNKPTAELEDTATLTYAGIFVYDQLVNSQPGVVQGNSPGIRYDYSNNKWQLRKTSESNAQDGWEDMLTTANQTNLTAASIASTLQGTNTTDYVVPDGLRSWTTYSTPGIGISFPESGVSNAAGTTEVQYAKTVKATAIVTEANANAGFFSIYHGLGNVYPIVNVYVAEGDDYYQVIPKLLVDDSNTVKIYIQGITTGQTYYIGITG